MILPCITGSGGKIELLWTNPNPTSDFTPLTVQADVAAYDYILVVQKRSKSIVMVDATGLTIARTLIKVSNNLNVTNYVTTLSDDTNTPYKRQVTLTATSIIFGGSGTTLFSVPVYVYGIKSDTVIG